MLSMRIIHINIQILLLCLSILHPSTEETLNDTLKDIKDELDILKTRVINGQNADLHEWPWQVSLEYNRQHVCGGSIIKPDWVLTAAHCFTKLRYVPAWRVVIGRHTIKGVTKFERRYTVRRIYLHAYYHQTYFINDVALIQIQGSVVLSKQVNVIQLPKQDNRVPVGSMCYITGWGQTNGMIKESAAHVLQEAPLTIASFWHCSLRNSQLNIKVDDKTMICAGGGGKGGCMGDSGGPLACNEHGRWMLRGVVSWGHAKCFVHEFYTVFARVSSFVGWATKIMEQSPTQGPCSRSGIVCLNGGTPLCYNNVPVCRCRLGFSGKNCQYGSSSSVNRPSHSNVTLKCYACTARNGNCQSGLRQCIWPNTRCGKVRLGTATIKGCTSPSVCAKYCSLLRQCQIDCCEGNYCNGCAVARPFVVMTGLCVIAYQLLKPFVALD